MIDTRSTLKIFGGVIIALLLALVVYSEVRHSAMHRKVAILIGKGRLKQVAKEHEESGLVTNFGSSHYQVWLSTNFATIGGTQYHCFVTVRESQFRGEGTMAMTTNGTFIWLNKNQEAKLIGTNYEPRLFPPRF